MVVGAGGWVSGDGESIASDSSPSSSKAEVKEPPSSGREVRLMPNVGRLGSQASKKWMGKLLHTPPSLNQLSWKSTSGSNIAPCPRLAAVCGRDAIELSPVV